MRRGVRRFSRPVCLLLVCMSLALHLLLAIVALSVLQMTCGPSAVPSSQAASRSTNASFVTSPSRAAETLQGKTSSDRNLKNTDMAQKVRTRGHGALQQGNKLMSSLNVAEKKSHLGSSEKASGVGQSKLSTLFEHPLYNLPRPSCQEGDWLLRMKSKTKDDTDSSQEWVSAGEDGYDEIQWNNKAESHPPWLRFHLAISRWELYDRRDPNVLPLLKQMATHRIVSAVQKPGGTQLKLIMSFPNYGQALFKPMKQERDEETNFNLFYFSDFERHNAEIAAFHLDRILGFQRVPPVVGRLINITKEIKQVTTDRQLARTFYTSPVGNVCFYGQCSYYCSPEHALCGRPHVLEASLASMLPDLSLAPRRSWRSPWRRSYSRSKLAQWEKDPNYCDTVKKTPPYNKGTRLVDLIDMAILDFLMNNMDRHHYETFEKFGNDTFLLHLDNGRAFGRHSRDEPSILAPLRQCCRLRRSTLLRLHLLSLPQFRLSDVMRESLSQDPLTSVAPLLSEPHLAALDRRLATVLREVQQCREQHPAAEQVIYDDVGTHAANDITDGW